MRTTLNIDPALIDHVKRESAARGQSVGRLVEDALREFLFNKKEEKPTVPQLPVFTSGTGLQPGIDPSSNASLLDAADDENGTDVRL